MCTKVIIGSVGVARGGRKIHVRVKGNEEDTMAANGAEDQERGSEPWGAGRF